MKVNYRRLFRSANPLLGFARRKKKLGFKFNKEAGFENMHMLSISFQFLLASVSVVGSPGLDLDNLIYSSLALLLGIFCEFFLGFLSRYFSIVGVVFVNVSLGMLFAELIPIYFNFVGLFNINSARLFLSLLLLISSVCLFATCCLAACTIDCEWANKFSGRGHDHILLLALSCSMLFSLFLPLVLICRLCRQALRH